MSATVTTIFLMVLILVFGNSLPCFRGARILCDFPLGMGDCHAEYIFLAAETRSRFFDRLLISSEELSEVEQPKEQTIVGLFILEGVAQQVARTSLLGLCL